MKGKRDMSEDETVWIGELEFELVERLPGGKLRYLCDCGGRDGSRVEIAYSERVNPERPWRADVEHFSGIACTTKEDALQSALTLLEEDAREALKAVRRVRRKAGI